MEYRSKIGWQIIQQVGLDNISSVSEMYWWTVGGVSVRYRWCIGWQFALPVQLFFPTLYPKAFPFVSRYLSTDSWWTRLLTTDWSVSKSQAIFMHWPTFQSCISQHNSHYIGRELADLWNDSQMRYQQLSWLRMCWWSVNQPWTDCRPIDCSSRPHDLNDRLDRLL